MSDNIKVVVKLRPLIPREIEDKLNYQWRVDNNTLYQIDQNGKDWGPSFTFDKVYGADTKTIDVYEDVAKPIVEAATAGFNGTIFAYGQTSSGKTYTMTGTDDSPGIIPLAVLNLFHIIKQIRNRDFLVRISYVEIYNESLIDLLDIKKPIKVFDTLQGIKVDATEKLTTSPEEVLEIMRTGKANRQTGATNMNEESSRSHSIFQITIESREHIEGEEEVGSVNVSQLNLVDLAGSERSGQTGATGLRFKEGTHINKSLSSLALVIKQLSEGHSANKHVNYRDSKLTRILQNSLGGNAKTSIICAVTPAAIEETISTLQFANRAKAIKNTPAVNAVATNATMIQTLTKQLSTLKTQLENKKTLEQDNFKLHKQIQQLQKLIINGFAESSRRKPVQPRRMTISTLIPIQEDPPSIPSFCTPSLKYNPLSLASLSEFAPLQSACSLPSVSEEPRLITPPPDRKVNFSDEVIQLDSDDDDTPTNVQTCSPYHKCYNSSKTPPCILRKTAKQAEKNLKDIVELTEREKIYMPSVIELMEKLETKTLRIAELEEKLDKLSNTSKEKDLEMNKLKSNISRAEQQIAQITSAKEELEKSCKDYNTKLTDWEVSYETLKKKSKTREDELLSLLQEHENRKKREEKGKISSKIMEQERNLLDMSRDISLVDSDFENSIISKQPTLTDLQSQLTLKDQTILELEANLLAQKSRIDSLVNVNKELQEMISSYKEKVSYMENENSLHKSTIDNLNNTIENQKLILEGFKADIESYNSVIHELQVKLTNKDCKKEISDNDIETMIANEEMFIANNENMKNIIQSLKTVLNVKNEEIKQLKSALDNTHQPNVDFLDDIKNKQQEILAYKEEIEKLKSQESDKISLIDKLVQEKNDLLSVELQLKIQLSGIQKDKELLEKQIELQILEVANLKECNEKNSAELMQKEIDIAYNKELKNKVKDMCEKIKNLEKDINVKDETIKTLYKEDNEKEENLRRAKLTLEKLQNIMSLFTDGIINVPNVMDTIVIALNTLNDNLTSLESVASDIIKEKDEVRKLLEKREYELHTLQTKLDDFNNVVDSLYGEYQTNLDVNNEHHSKINEDVSESIKCKLINIMNIINSTHTYLKQALHDKEKELEALKCDNENNKIELQMECNKNIEISKQIQDLVLKRDEYLLSILNKATQLTSDFNIENSISCQLNSDPENTYEEIILTLDKVSNHITILQSGHLAEQSNIDVILTDAKNEIAQLTQENLKLLQDIEYLESTNSILSSERKTIEDESISLTRNLEESKNLLNQVQRDLLTKTSEMEIIQSKAEQITNKFKNIEKSMKNQIDILETENIELKSRCSELEIKGNIVELDSDLFSKKEKFRKSDTYIDVNAPPSLLTICCNRIIDAIQPSDDNSISSISTTNLKDNEYAKMCQYEELKKDIDALKADNNRLKLRIQELENNNEANLKEKEEVQKEVRLLLDYTHELQKKILKHRTNLSTLTATTYAENKSLSSQVKVLQHHNSRFHTVCLRDIPDVKKQLQFLMTVLKSENFGKLNDSFKRFSLPNALDTISLHSTFKNDSTIDGDLLMLDTNVTLTTCDNTLVANEQTCLDITQVCTYNEVACQTNFDEITQMSTPQVVTGSFENFKLVETLESLRNENNKLRDLVEDYSKYQELKTQVIDAQSSPIKMVGSLNNSLSSTSNPINIDSCGDCKHKDEMKIVEEKFQLEIKVMTEKLLNLESQKNDMEEKYHNLTLEIPNMDLLARELSSLENKYSKKQNEIKVLTDSLNKKNKDIQNLQEENDSLSNQLMESISEVDDLKKEHESLKEINNNLISKFSQLEQEIENVKCDKSEHQEVCSECLLKDEIIRSFESKLANSHTKLDRSYRDAESSSRYNKICTLQNELHAGKEDCIELKEEVTTIKNHLESNISISHAMDLDESISETLMCSFNKDFGHLKTENDKYTQNIIEEQSLNTYNLDKIDCVNYFTQITGTDKKIFNCDIKIIDLMRMLCDNFTVKHSREVENLVNKVKDFEETRSNLENQIDQLNNKQAQIAKELKEKDSYLQTMANVVSQLRNNIDIINNDIESANIVNNFSEKFLKKVDKEFGFSSASTFEIMVKHMCQKYNDQIEKMVSENQKLDKDVHDMTVEINSINENLNLVKLQLNEKASEVELLQRKNEEMHKINSTVTLDIVSKEKVLKETIAKQFQKLLHDKVITQTIDLSVPSIQILELLFEHISTYSKQNNQEILEKERSNIVLQLDQFKKNLDNKETELQTLIEKLTNNEDANKKLHENLIDKEQELISQKSLHEELKEIYEKKVEENYVNISTINKLSEEVSILKETIVNKDILIVSLESKINELSDELNKINEAKVTEFLQSSTILYKEIESLKSINEIILKEKETCAEDLKNACVTIKEYKINFEKLTSDIKVLTDTIKEHSHITETLRLESKTLQEENKALEARLQEGCDNCNKLSNNIKTHERTAQIQSGMIIRLQKQKEDVEKESLEKDKVVEELKEKCKCLEMQCEVMNNKLKTSKDEIKMLSNTKKLLEVRISELESEVRDKSDFSTEAIAETARRRRQSIQDSKRMFTDDNQDHAKLESVFKARSKADDMFMDVDDESSSRSSPIRMSAGRDSLISKHEQSDNIEDQSRPSSVVASRRRRQSVHDQHRAVPVRRISSRENSRDSSRNNSIDSEVTQLRKQLTSCQQELDELKDRYKELDEECEICAQYLRERDDQCMRLKKEKLALEKTITELNEKLTSIPNASISNGKKSYKHASVNTDEDWANLHSVVVDRMSYNAEVEKNKKLMKSIEELRYKNQDLKTTMSKMQKVLEKHNVKDNFSKELEATKAELSSCKKELEELREKYKELDEECETCAEYLRERDEQCRKLKEAKASLEAKLEEYQEISNISQTVRKKRRTLHDQNRPPTSTTLNDASTETSDDFLSYQVEKDDTRNVDEVHSKEIKRLKMAVERLSQTKASLEHQLMAVTATPVYVATGSAIVQNQQITDVMKENQKLKKMNAKLINICKKRGKSHDRENEDPANNLT